MLAETTTHTIDPTFGQFHYGDLAVYETFKTGSLTGFKSYALSTIAQSVTCSEFELRA